MAKKNNRKKDIPQGNTAVAEKSADKVQLEKLIPNWRSALENTSKVYQSKDEDLEINVDQDYLKALIKAIPDDKANQFKAWVQQFASVCKELDKYQHNLEAECKARWDSCNKQGLEQEAKETELAEKDAELKTLEKTKEAEFAEKYSELKAKKEAIEVQAEGVAEREEELAFRDSQLLIAERDIQARELNAEQGFARQNREALAGLENQQRELEADYQKGLEQIRAEKTALKDDIRNAARQLAELRNTRSEEEHQRLCELEEREYRVLAREQENKEKNTKLEREWQDLKAAKANIDCLVDESIEKERESHKLELERLNKKLNKAWSNVDSLKAQLSDFKELAVAMGELSAEELLQQQEELKQDNRSLRRKLEDSDTVEYEEQNEQLRSQVNSQEKELKDLRPKLAQAHIEAAQKRVAATELQAKEQERRVLEQHQGVLKVYIDDLENRIGQLTDANKTQTPFPAMSAMDSKKLFQSTKVLEDIPNLEIFADELQHRIAQVEKVKLFYPIEDIRTLLGGLAMSQLHVFQGISGTGKTSLAKAFAKAMGGFCTDIAVQAGWRDRDDLIGHYNAFEKRYYEKDCLQALYQAQTPRWNDTCNVILLDEMNLSRPEQYFSEFLSALEKNDPNDRRISLSETELPNAPKGLKGGRQILVPENVWFIGTANHDETTSELADKTYDRSHVMTLPKQDHSFDIKPYDRKRYSYSSLMKAFDEVAKKGESEVVELLGKLTSHDITNQLADTFDLGWGNRFERQAKRFIPVMLACGATEGQALDHLLSTRVMRNGKVTGRYDVNADAIGKLTDSLEYFWASSGISGDPLKSLELLKADLKRKERGG